MCKVGKTRPSAYMNVRLLVSPTSTEDKVVQTNTWSALSSGRERRPLLLTVQAVFSRLITCYAANNSLLG